MKQQVTVKHLRLLKIAEIAFWGAVLWGFARMAASFFRFTPYGVRSFSRGLIGMDAEDTASGIVLGFLVLLAFLCLATLLYALIFSKWNIWWGGILYGLAWFVLFGYFFEFNNWTVNTLSTELTWFLSLGIFVGMSVSTEQMDIE
ncbi:MAG: YqhR family membrane protein [Clostridia bacterium]